MNVKPDMKFTLDYWVCDDCRNGHKNERDSQNHVEALEVFRIGKDLSNDQDMVDFLKSVIDHRMKKQ